MLPWVCILFAFGSPWVCLWFCLGFALGLPLVLLWVLPLVLFVFCFALVLPCVCLVFALGFAFGLPLVSLGSVWFALCLGFGLCQPSCQNE